MIDLEQLGAFYLGRVYDLAAGAARAEPILYDARDLTTHAVIVGMTGSGKTGRGVALLEEAALDGIPATSGTCLAFPRLRPEDFRPWIDEGAAARAGRTPDEHARWTADLWRRGLGDWGQDGARVGRFRDAAETAIYTPGSRAGTVGRATTAARGAGRAMREREDVARAEARLAEQIRRRDELGARLERDLERLRADHEPARFPITELTVRARKADVAIDRLVLAWTPWAAGAGGAASPLF